MKKTLTILIVIISLFLGIFIGIILEKKVLNNSNDINDLDNNQNNEVIDNNENLDNNDEEIRKQVEEIVSNELDQLLPKKSLNELTNQDKLQTILYIYASENSYSEIINKEVLETIFKNSSLRNLEIEYTDIYFDHMLQDTNEKFYEIQDNIYKKIGGGHGASQLNTIYKEVTDYKKNENKITISYKFAFYTVLGEGPNPINLYYTYEDALNDKNKIISYEPSDYLTAEDASGYITAFNAAKNYDFSKLLDKLDTYTYTFEINNNDIVLVDFNRK